MKRKQVADWLFAIGVAGVGAVYLFWIYRPQIRAIDETEKQIVATRSEISRSEAFVRGLDDLGRYLKDFEDALAGLDRLVPAKTDADQRFREVIAVADRCGLHDTNVRPDSPQPNGSVVKHPLVVKVTGTYPEVQRFLFEAEALERLTRVTRFHVQHADAAKGTASSDKPEESGDVLAEIELTSYSILPQKAGSS